MRSTLLPNSTPVEPKYPCLKISNSGVVVLFSKKNTGTVVHANEYSPLGEHRDHWGEGDYFVPFNGTVELKG